MLQTVIARDTKNGTLYHDPVTHRFWKEVEGKRHYYRKSVTGILNDCIAKPGLVYWAVELGEDYLLDLIASGKVLTEMDVLTAGQQHTIRKQEAADIGTQAHEWIDHWLNGENPEIPADQNVAMAIQSFLTFQRDHQVKWHEGEQIVCSDTYGYAGRYDRVAEIDGKLYLVDFKTSNAINPEYALQTALYQIAEEECSLVGRVFAGRAVLRFAKETKEDYEARMERKNEKRKKRGQEPKEVIPYQPFEVVYYTENEKDKLAALAGVNLSLRLQELK